MDEPKPTTTPEEKEQLNFDLRVAVSRRAVGDVEKALAAGADVDARDAHNETTLHRAAELGDVAVVRVLLEAGAKVDPQIKHFGDTPLHKAAKNKHRDVADMLMVAGADPTLKTDRGLTPAGMAGSERPYAPPTLAVSDERRVVPAAPAAEGAPPSLGEYLNKIDRNMVLHKVDSRPTMEDLEARGIAFDMAKREAVLEQRALINNGKIIGPETLDKKWAMEYAPKDPTRKNGQNGPRR